MVGPGRCTPGLRHAVLAHSRFQLRKHHQVGRQFVEVGLDRVSVGLRRIIVDQVQAVLDIRASDIEPAPAFGSALRTDFMAGVAKVAGRFVLLLDVDQVLSIEEMAELASGTAREGRQP